MARKACVTGGAGFIGSYLVKELVSQKWEVVVVDTFIRGSKTRLDKFYELITIFDLDIRDENSLEKIFQDCEVVFHLAAINGTENFYTHPDLVFDIGVRGAISVMNACKKAGVSNVVIASSAEVYQTPSVVPTPENIELMLPDSLNPRFSYGGSKIASELIAFNYGRDFFSKVQVFRPHNVYGPDMGSKHVVPQFINRFLNIKEYEKKFLEIRGSGEETRAFCYVDDIVKGILIMYEFGEHRQIYHIGNDEEISIKELACKIGELMKLNPNFKNLPLLEGGTDRRCPDITKMRRIGYIPKINLDKGLRKTITWYEDNRSVFRNANNLL